MSRHDVDRVARDRYELVRQVRSTPPRLDLARAEAILKRHNRLRECVAEHLDEAKARRVLEELRAQGAIGGEGLPLRPGRSVEALVIRPVE